MRSELFTVYGAYLRQLNALGNNVFNKKISCKIIYMVSHSKMLGKNRQIEGVPENHKPTGYFFFKLVPFKCIF